MHPPRIEIRKVAAIHHKVDVIQHTVNVLLERGLHSVDHRQPTGAITKDPQCPIMTGDTRRSDMTNNLSDPDIDLNAAIETDPVVPSADKKPVVASADEEPVVPSADEKPVVPSADDGPVTDVLK